MSSREFPFLQLPVEIRLLVYQYALPFSIYEYDYDGEKSDCPVTWFPGKCPGILFVNRQISQEARETLYRNNTFSIYVRHPREPRLPMNAGRADPESIMLISWAKRVWSHPKNPILPFSILRHHPNFRDIRMIHVSLPPFDDLLGVDVYMQRSSDAFFHGINAWFNGCSEKGGQIDQKDRDRIDYVQKIKDPIDEVAKLLRTVSWIDKLYLSLQSREREISFVEYMLTQLLALQNVKNVRAFYVPRYIGGRANPWVWGNPDESLLVDLKANIENAHYGSKEPQLSTDIDNMYRMLQSIRSKQQRNTSRLPEWLHIMPE